MGSTGSERRWWLAAAALIVAIYGTLYYVRAPVEFLRERGALRLSVALLFVIAAALGAWWVRKRRPSRREGLVLAVFAVLFGAAVLLAHRPEEKLHFLEYGLLGGLMWKASSLRAARLRSSRLRAALTAIGLAALAGWGDEGIQALLPNRYYDIKDIVWNVLGGSIVIVALATADAMRERAGGSGSIGSPAETHGR